MGTERAARDAAHEGRSLRHGAALRRAYEDGRREYGDLALDYALFTERFLCLTSRRLLAAGVATTDANVASALGRAAGADVYLAVACEEGAPGAWETFTQRFMPRIRALATRRGADETEADDLSQQLPAEMAAAPPGGGAKTRLGRYDGSASLFTWLAVICLRRLADRRRAAAARPVPAGHLLDSPAPARGSDPSRRASETEQTARFRAVLASAWEGLTSQERLVLLWKHRDGLPQTQIADLLGVGPPRVSRLVNRGVEKLRNAVACSAEGASWGALVRAVERHMATVKHSSETRRGEA